MPLNARQEHFVQAIVEGKPASEAYRLAGYKSVGGNGSEANASRLIRNDKVASRLNELRAEAAKRNEITVDLILRELEDARAAAMESGQISAAVAASMGRAKIAGLITDRVEQVLHKPSRVPTELTELSEEVGRNSHWQRRFRSVKRHYVMLTQR